MLGGQLDGHQALIDPHLDPLREEHAIRITRDFDSFLGFDTDIIVDADLMVNPIANFRDTLSTSIHLKLEVQVCWL